MQDDARLGATCESLTRDLIARLRPAMTSPREQLVTEDYIVFSLTALENRPTGGRWWSSAVTTSFDCCEASASLSVGKSGMKCSAIGSRT